MAEVAGNAKLLVLQQANFVYRLHKIQNSPKTHVKPVWNVGLEAATI